MASGSIFFKIPQTKHYRICPQTRLFRACLKQDFLDFGYSQIPTIINCSISYSEELKSYIIINILSTYRTRYCHSTINNNILIRCEMHTDD